MVDGLFLTIFPIYLMVIKDKRQFMLKTTLNIVSGYEILFVQSLPIYGYGFLPFIVDL